jgi:AcrR family transcriptional regulator
MARAPAMPPDERRAAVLAAARRVFGRAGYHRAGVADICDELGIARGTFYRYFEGKREVFQAVLADVMAEVAGVVHPIDVTRPIPDQIRANVDRLVRAITAEDVCRVLFAEAQGLDDEGDEALRAFYAGALGRIEAALRTGQALGVVRPGDVRLRARLLLGMLKEPVAQAALFGEPLDGEALVAELLEVLAAGIVRGRQA